MSDEELLEKVKAGLRVSGTSNDVSLSIKTIAVKEFMLNAGVTQAMIETNLGIATLTIGVSDLWEINSGEVEFSHAFKIVLLPQLVVMSIEE